MTGHSVSAERAGGGEPALVANCATCGDLKGVETEIGNQETIDRWLGRGDILSKRTVGWARTARLCECGERTVPPGPNIAHAGIPLTTDEIEAVLALDLFDSINWPEEDCAPPILGVKRKLLAELGRRTAGSEGDPRTGT